MRVPSAQHSDREPRGVEGAFVRARVDAESQPRDDAATRPREIGGDLACQPAPVRRRGASPDDGHAGPPQALGAAGAPKSLDRSREAPGAPQLLEVGPR